MLLRGRGFVISCSHKKGSYFWKRGFTKRGEPPEPPGYGPVLMHSKWNSGK